MPRHADKVNDPPAQSHPGEREIIARVAARFASAEARLITGLGDDAAVLRLEGAGPARRVDARHMVVTADMLVEGVHFDLRYMTLADAGYKALMANLSDVAAMGGRAAFAFGCLGVPRGITTAQIDDLLDGVEQAAKPHGVVLAGGDTVAAHRWTIAFTVLGTVQGPPLLRSGARPGDRLWHTGSLGLSEAGLRLLWGEAGGRPRTKEVDEARQAHRRPAPALDFAPALHAAHLAGAGLDTSDSLAQCVLLLAEASGVGVHLDFTRYAFHPAVLQFIARCGRKRRDGGTTLPAKLCPSGRREVYASLAEFVLSSAEDFQLLFTAPPAGTRELMRLAKAHGVALTPLGTVVETARGRTYSDETGMVRQLTPIGFQHLTNEQ